MSDTVSMKEWRPDRQFEKADFPVKKAGDEHGTTAKRSDSRKPSSGGARTAPNQPPEAQKAESSQPLKGWSVPKLGGGHVIAGGSTKNKAGLGDSSQGKVQRRDDAGESSVESSPVISTEASPGGGAGEAPQKKDMTRVYLSQLVGQDPRAATDILRSWYWEKPGRESPVKYIPPRNRIHLILRSLSKEALLALYEMMTPVERRQMEEIRKEPMHVNNREILKLRQYFMARMTGQI